MQPLAEGREQSRIEAGGKEIDAGLRSPSLRSRERLMLRGVMLGTAVIYLRSLRNGFVYDDDILVVNNSKIGNWSFLWKSLFSSEYWFADRVKDLARYRPLLLVWAGFNYHLFGLTPAGWHAATIGVHLGAVWLVFILARHLTGDVDAALIAALLFGLLPVHAEAVLWVAGFGLVLSGVFQMASLYFIVERSAENGKVAARDWTSALTLYAAALLSHETAVALPGIVAAYVFLFRAPGVETDGESSAGPAAARARKAILWAAPFAAEVILYFVIRRVVLGFAFTNPAIPVSDVGAAEVVMTIPRVLAEYLALLAIPSLAGPAHRILFVTSLGLASPNFYVAAIVLAAIAAGFAASVWNSERRELYLFCAAWILIAIAPVMDLFALPKDQIVHDNYLYFASAGWCVLIADAAIRFARRSVNARRLVWAACGAVAIVCAGALWNVQQFWRDDMALFTRCAAIFPESWQCHYNLGVLLRDKGDLHGAERELVTALDVRPDSGDTRYTLGLVRVKLGHVKEGAALMADGLEHTPRPPAKAFVTLAGLYEAQGDVASAERELAEALKIDSGSGEALYALGMMHARAGRATEGASEIARALKLMRNPPAAAYASLAEIYDAQGDRAESEAVLRQLESAPGGQQAAVLAGAQIRMRRGDGAGAEQVLRNGTARYPGDERIWTMLGLLLAQQKRNEDALAAYDRALGLAPNDARPHFFAAQTLHAMGWDREAVAQCEQALAIAPGDPNARALLAEIEKSLGSEPPAAR